MGCCVSTKKKPSSTSQKQQHFHVVSAVLSKPNSTHESRGPPPDPEETVKEVLSETPKLKPPPSSPPPPPLTVKKTHQQHDQKIHVQPPFLDEKIPKQNRDKNGEESMLSDQQDVSEVCSLSLSESVSTTAVTNDRRDYYYDDDDEGEVRQRVTMRPSSPKLVQRNREFSSDLGPKRDRVVGKSPTRRSERSPKKRNINAGGGSSGVRMVQSGEPVVGKRAGIGSDRKKRDPGESSGRRSRSPASNRSVMGRSPSTRRTNRSPRQVGKDPRENGGAGGSNMKMEGGQEPKSASTSSNGATTSESLENPLVSLECFIFL